MTDAPRLYITRLFVAGLPTVRGQQLENVVIRRLRKVDVPRADRGERLRHADTDHVVRDIPKRLARLPCADWNRYHHALRPEPPNREHGCAHGGARRQPVVDENHDAPGDGKRRSILAVGAFPALELCPRRARHSRDGRCRRAMPGEDVLIQHAHTAAGKGSGRTPP
jgi:hypothetical protein